MHTLIVVHDIAEVVSPAVMSLAHAHRVVREVDIAVVACRRLGCAILSKKAGNIETLSLRRVGRKLTEDCIIVSI
jgi:hypothetical protein